MAAETEELLSGSWVARGQGKSCVEWEGEMAVTTRGAEVGVSVLFRGAEPCPTTSHDLRRFRGVVVGTGGRTFRLYVAGGMQGERKERKRMRAVEETTDAASARGEKFRSAGIRFPVRQRSDPAR